MSSYRILLASRDQLLISLCKRSVDHETGTVMIAADCDETLDAVEYEVPHLVILDTAADRI